MARQKQYVPIYQQFIQQLVAGFNLLDVESQKMVRKFVSSQQHANGGFFDRGADTDLYYSLFGFWLISATEASGQLERLTSFIADYEEPERPIERFSWMLLRKALLNQQVGRPNFFNQLLKRDHPVNFSYQLFLYLLVFDARYGRKKWMNILLRLLLSFYQIPEGAPSSLLAALLIARAEVGLSTQKIEKRLMSYFDDEGGFSSFNEAKGADMLSTGVVLFALHKAEFDIRLIAPRSFNFVQQNFEQGAFLSGDGDKTRDLEYTFYGLLALGCLAGGTRLVE